LLRPGLVLAIEPMITEGEYQVEILKDGWTVVTADGKLAAHFEHTIAVTDDGPKILTLRSFGEHPDVEKYRPKEEAVA
jgi:methionyl aminopeptidase